jgi:bifunctional UDP-N-acetylglucosamine pyrophosphorylase/glucosamine-1-phosphate N-acetyltransferase
MATRNRTAPHTTPELSAVVMAAGLGTRMRSELVKVLHPLCGLPMVGHVLELTRRLGVKRTLVVVGHQADRVKEALAEQPVEFIRQAEQRGTAHAILQTEEALAGYAGDVLVLSGDVPLLSDELVGRLLAAHRQTKADATVVSTLLDAPTGYGRILRDRSRGFRAIVEEVEATAAQRRVKEINSGLYCFRAPRLFAALRQVQPSSVKGELYLTDVLAILKRDGGRVAIVSAEDSREVLGINTRAELAEAAAVLRRRAVERLMADGVTCLDPTSVYVSVQASVGRDTTLHPNVQIEGATRIGEGCTIHAGSRIRASRLGDRVTVLDGCVILESEVDDDCSLGPYAHLRPGNRLARKVKVGNFVEAKKTIIGEGSKVPHLSYVGDAILGERVNVGAGTITCNYDGYAKHLTEIEDGVFIGSNSCLVAPVRIGRGAFVAAGSTITEEVPPDAVAFGRARQVVKPGRAAELRKLRTKA